MGSDDLFKKRKIKNIKNHQRRVANRQPYERILIVCEGEKTEPFYFLELCKNLSLHTANVEITGDCDSSPHSVFSKAKELFDDSKKQQNTFDRVYCVFDRDNHPDYLKTINSISSQKPKNIFSAVTSVPCFEYWLLLHFTYTTKPLSNALGAINELKNFIPNYEKGNKKIFQTVKDSLDFALSNARRANSEAKKNYTDNPSTLVVDLVEKLRNLKNR
ncbi:MAG: RloB domain-containing protein [Neisseria sp.]|jgi:hypothetical protein|nr:RloB domain-containing protein [Neisseria sp.]